MVKETAGQEILLTTIDTWYFYFERIILAQQSCRVLLFTFEHYILLVQMWVAGEGPTIEWSYLPRKIAREKRTSFRGHGD